MGGGDKVLYLDHAATSWPKPPSVSRAMERCMREAGGNPGRGTHRLSLAAADILWRCREKAASFFGAPGGESVVFTLNTTYALNMAIKSVVRPGDHVLISNLEHNAVYRPVLHLAKEAGVSYDIFDICVKREKILRELSAKLRPNTRAVICLHASNIVNVTAPAEAIGSFCRQKGICFILDGAQSAGHLPIHMGRMKIDMLCVPGHKGLYGPGGIGMLLLGDKTTVGATLIEGGSGVHSLDPEMPRELPERFEAGTMPAPAAAGLLAGMEWVDSVGLCAIRRREEELWCRLYGRLSEMEGVSVFDRTPGAILLFTVRDRMPSEIAAALDRQGICVRAGYHCAPLAHRTVGSFGTGAVRVSFGAANTEADVIRFADTLFRIVREG